MTAAQLALPTDAPAGMPALRPFQQRVVRAVALEWAAGKRCVLVVAATGSGKTIMAGALVRELVRRGRRVLFVVHRDVLIGQTADKLASFGIRHGYIKAGYPENRAALVQIASVQTLERRDWWYAQSYDDEENPPTIFFDECHITAFARVSRKLLAAHKRMRAVGLTATPWRLSPREDMGDVFDGLALAPYPAELIDAGFLVPPTYYGTAAPPDLQAVRTRGGEYVEEDLLKACDRPELIAALAKEWQQHAGGGRTLCFCTGVQHAHHVAEHFAGLGVAAAAVDGETPIPERTALYERLRSGDLLVLASCMVLQEGFDVPEVACVALCRPTKSRALFLQQLGRGLRIAPWDRKTTCTVLDQAGNIGRFGFVEDFADFELRRGDPQARAEPCPRAPLTTRECPRCHRISRREVPVCPGCGYVWPRRMDKRQAQTTAALRDLAQSLPLPDRILLYRDLLRAAYRQKYRPEWAAAKYRERVGAWPDRSWVTGAIFGMHPTESNGAEYRSYLQGVADAKGLDHEWVVKWEAFANGVQS